MPLAMIGKDINKAVKVLDAGGLVAVPTETVYGLGANALSEEAVLKVFKAKARPAFDPLICHVSSIEKAERIVEGIPGAARRLASHFWPGPLTMLLPKRQIVPDLVTSGLDTVAVRVPRHKLITELLERVDYPIAAPSANPFGYISPTSAQHVADQLGDKIDYILDGGKSDVGVESTIISLSGSDLNEHRLGGLSVEEIEDVAQLKSVLKINNSSNPSAPGMLKSHYAPKIPLVVGDIPDLIEQHENKRIGVISLKSDYSQYGVEQILLSREGLLPEAAKNLFSALRTMDYASIDVILAEFVPDEGLGKAINDRLRRAEVKLTC